MAKRNNLFNCLQKASDTTKWILEKIGSCNTLKCMTKVVKPIVSLDNSKDITTP